MLGILRVKTPGAFHRRRVALWLTPSSTFASSLKTELNAALSSTDEEKKESSQTEDMKGLRARLKERSASWEAEKETEMRPSKLQTQLVGLATTKQDVVSSYWREDSDIGFFDLPLEQLCGQIEMPPGRRAQARDAPIRARWRRVQGRARRRERPGTVPLRGYWQIRRR